VKEFKVSTKKVIKVTLDDKEYNVRVPAVKDQLKLKEMTKDAESGSEQESMALLNWLEDLGLPKEASMMMHQTDLTIFIQDYLMDDKKK
jgi:hypothetical protein